MAASLASARLRVARRAAQGVQQHRAAGAVARLSSREFVLVKVRGDSNYQSHTYSQTLMVPLSSC